MAAADVWKSSWNIVEIVIKLYFTQQMFDLSATNCSRGPEKGSTYPYVRVMWIRLKWDKFTINV